MKKIILLIFLGLTNFIFSQGLKFNTFFSQEKQSFSEKFSSNISEINKETYFILDIKDKYIYMSNNDILHEDVSKFEIFGWDFDNTKFECFDKKNGDIVHIEIPKNKKFIIVANDCQSTNDNKIICNKRKVYYNKGDLKIIK
ncbi:hypothetical protein QFZ37_003517 [Chryseobacterium ginsenosidimutans]|uniref:hypothetical protein n=1 Tax=Chryseobacterium ginsenosidimutans TaxID=687846 RepID=UPI0027829BDE|nr:hypothetical protein [Chryseobacterium ginsenosidimutans]MDQ0595148.1 hypothetical protein [Chryseobacterium ginsenosidimutans]